MKAIITGVLLCILAICLSAELAWQEPVVVVNAANTQFTGASVTGLGDDVVVVWLQRSGNYGLFQIRMQIILPDGSRRFGSEGVPISTNCINGVNPQAPGVLITPTGEIFISWFDSLAGDYKAQLFTSEAQPLWGVDPISLSGVGSSAQVTYLDGSFIIVYAKQDNSGVYRIWGQKIMNGEQVWQNGGLQLVAPHPQHSTSGTQYLSVVGSYLAWHYSSFEQLFALKITADGNPAPGFEAWGKQISQRSAPYNMGEYTFKLMGENLYCRWYKTYEVHPSFEYWSIIHTQQILSSGGDFLIPGSGVVDLDEGDPFALEFFGYDPGVGEDFFLTGNGDLNGYRLRRFTPSGTVYTDSVSPIVPIPHHPGCEVFCLEGLSDGTALLILKHSTGIKYEHIDLQGNLVTTAPNLVFGQYFGDSSLYSSRQQDTLLILGAVTPNSTTNGSLLLQKVISSGSSASDFTAVKPRLQLSETCPNPFQDNTMFTCRTDQTEKFDIAVYNLKGQRVRSIYQGILSAGKTEFTWDGRNARGQSVPNGVYFLRARTDKEVVLRKLLKYK